MDDDVEQKEKDCFVSVLRCMERNVEDFGDKIAICDEHNSITFAELHKMAGRRAFAIRQHVAGKGNCIGINASNSADTVVNILSVLYSGNFYLLLDTFLPEYIVHDVCRRTNVKLLLTSEVNFGLENKGSCIVTSEIISETETFYAEMEAEDCLYTVLTSGTTGKPKIILKTHEAMELFIQNYIQVFHLTSREIIGNGIPFYSDASAKDIYSMIYLGARLVIVPEKFFAVPYMLIRYMNKENITIISWVPSAYSLVAHFDILKVEIPKSLRKAIFIGEQVPIETVLYWREKMPLVSFYNTYGMSELAGICAWYEIPEGNQEQLAVGQPFVHCKLIFVDEQMRPSDKGKLLLKSASLALGYFTDYGFEKLEMVEIETENGVIEEFYDTGDIGKLDKQGNYVITGRNDYQIKYMGYRIELQGIEAILMKFKSVCNTVCLFDDNRIVAVIQLASDTCEERKKVEHYCRIKLQRYMRPSVYCYVNEMPLNRNGKINRYYLQNNWKGFR